MENYSNLYESKLLEDSDTSKFKEFQKYVSNLNHFIKNDLNVILKGFIKNKYGDKFYKDFLDAKNNGDVDKFLSSYHDKKKEIILFEENIKEFKSLLVSLDYFF